MGRKPDIRYNITEDKLVSLKELQQSILSVVQAYVKRGRYNDVQHMYN